MAKNELDDGLRVFINQSGRDVAEFYVAYKMLEMLHKDGHLKPTSEDAAKQLIALMMVAMHSNLDLTEDNPELLLFMKEHYGLYAQLTELLNKSVYKDAT